jgi:hypothetical protein
MRRLLISSALLVTCALLAACGSGSETGTIGTSEVTISGEPKTLVDTLRAVAEQEPYERWALNCVVGQFEKIITPAVEEELEGASEKEVGEFLTPHLAPINRVCEEPGRHIFNPHATEEELAVVRSSEVVGLRLVLKAGEVPTAERECAESKVANLPGPKLVALIEADEAEREVLFEELVSGCIGKR